MLAMVVVMALLEVATVASIMPFLSLLGDPGLVETNQWFSMAYEVLSFSSYHSFLVFVGAMVMLLLIIGNAFKCLTTWVKVKFVRMRGYSLSRKLFTYYLSRPYSFFLNRNSADLTKNVLSEVDHVIQGIMVPGMELISNFIVVSFLVCLLLLVDPGLILVVVVFLSAAYLLIYKFIRNKLNVKGKSWVKSNIDRYTIASEAFGGIKDVKLMALEKEFIQRYEAPALKFARHQAYQEVSAKLPKFIMESVAFGGIVVIGIYLLTKMGSREYVMSILGMFAFAGYKVLPALQQIFAALTKFKFSIAALDIVYSEIVFSEKVDTVLNQSDHDFSPIKLRNSLKLEDIFYCYPGSKQQVLNGLSLRIKAMSSVGLVGTTGSGKTTLVDMILGLLEPGHGNFLVDGISIDSRNVGNWQKILGYVPQNIYLSDDTVASNIAFGQNPSNIDMEKVVNAAKLANMHQFIQNDLPKGYDTIVGERGIRLSGGQRQRIGIARALYREPEVLILDEATSALDNLTERSVMQAMYNLIGKKTVIIIAHRLTTVQHCDVIHVLKKGRVAASGTYDELLSKDHLFQSMVGANKNGSINSSLHYAGGLK